MKDISNLRHENYEWKIKTKQITRMNVKRKYIYNKELIYQFKTNINNLKIISKRKRK